MLAKERKLFGEPRTVKLEELEYTNIYNDPDKKKNQAAFAAANKNSSIPIIIDYGSNSTKAVSGEEYMSILMIITNSKLVAGP